jgi:hypothetical protein
MIQLCPELWRRLERAWSRLQRGMVEHYHDQKIKPSQLEMDEECVGVFEQEVDNYLEFLGQAVEPKKEKKRIGLSLKKFRADRIKHLKDVAREALKGAQFTEVDAAMEALEKCSDLFCPVMDEVSSPCSDAEFAGMVVITILQIRSQIR